MCPVYDAGVQDGIYYLTMRFLKGKLLSDYTGKAQPPRKAVEIVTKLAQALEAAHDKGVIHRDLKPSNVMMVGGVGPVVMDFGLAKQVRQAGPEADPGRGDAGHASLHAARAGQRRPGADGPGQRTVSCPADAGGFIRAKQARALRHAWQRLGMVLGFIRWRGLGPGGPGRRLDYWRRWLPGCPQGREHANPLGLLCGLPACPSSGCESPRWVSRPGPMTSLSCQ